MFIFGCCQAYNTLSHAHKRSCPADKLKYPAHTQYMYMVFNLSAWPGL